MCLASHWDQTIGGAFDSLLQSSEVTLPCIATFASPMANKDAFLATDHMIIVMIGNLSYDLSPFRNSEMG